MSKLDKEQISHIATLSRLKLSNEEVLLYSQQLSSVLDYVDLLQEVDTSNTDPMSNVTGLSNVTRKDEIINSNICYDDLSKNAPEFKDGNFVVPGIFE